MGVPRTQHADFPHCALLFASPRLPELITATKDQVQVVGGCPAMPNVTTLSFLVKRSLRRLRRFARARKRHPGEALKTTSRSYQAVGLRWLGFLSRLGLGACLADDMGLGKTIQVLALLLTVSEGGGERRPSLIVAPASLIANWAAEAERFAPSLNVFVAHPAFTPAELLKSTSAEDLVGIDLVVTSYAALLTHTQTRSLSNRKPVFSWSASD